MEPCTSYLANGKSMPFCRGCGHALAVRRLDAALVKLQLDPAHVCIVSDIGCIGLVDNLFKDVHTVHTTHGRSTAFATGIEIADSVLADSKLKSIVFIGDGGAMIGLLHLVQAALMNVDVTVLLCNNFLFGMTGGQNSAFSPLDFITTTTPRGSFIPPLDIWKMMESCNAGFIARKLATDGELADVLAEAIAYPGFALVEIVELCTEFGVRYNEMGGRELQTAMEKHGQRFGVSRCPPRIEFSVSYSNRYEQEPFLSDQGAEGFQVPRFQSRLEKPVGIVIAGTAGERVQSSASSLCEAAVLSGLHSTQKNDNPVTQGSGYSLAEVIISPEPILYTGIEHPHSVIVTSTDGLGVVKAKGMLERLDPSSHLVIDASLPVPRTEAEIHQAQFRKEFGPKGAAFAAVDYFIKLLNILPSEALDAVLERINRGGRGRGTRAVRQIENRREPRSG